MYFLVTGLLQSHILAHWGVCFKIGLLVIYDLSQTKFQHTANEGFSVKIKYKELGIQWQDYDY